MTPFFLIHASQNHPTWRIPYNGVVEIASGEVAPDVAFYLASSEQRNTAIGVGLHLDPASGAVESAGGFYIEMMPGACKDGPLLPRPPPVSHTHPSTFGAAGVEEDSIVQVEANLADLKEKHGSLDPGQLFAGAKVGRCGVVWCGVRLPCLVLPSWLPACMYASSARTVTSSLTTHTTPTHMQPLTPYKLVKELLYGLGCGTATEQVPQYRCTCSKDKVFRAMKLLSEEEIDDILAKEGRIVARCEFCAEVS